MKNRLLIALLIAGCLYKTTTAQITFQKYYAPPSPYPSIAYQPYCVEQTRDSGYIVAGNSSGALLVKTDRYGNLTWNKNYVSNEDALATWVQQTSDGGYIISGYGGAPSWGFLIKTDQFGDTIWTKTYSNSYNQFNYVEQTNDNGYVIAGSIDTPLTYLPCVIRVDSIGNVVWAIGYGDTSYSPRAFNVVHQTPDGGFIVSGNPPILLKLNSVGERVWSKACNGFMIINSMVLTADSGYVFAGKTGLEDFSYYYGMVGKMDKNGNVVWQNQYNNSNNAKQVRQTITGGYVVTLTYGLHDNEQHICPLKLDNAGNFQWGYSYQIPDRGTDFLFPGDFEPANDGGFIFAGKDFFSQILFLLKTDGDGRNYCNDTALSWPVISSNYTAGNDSETMWAVPTTLGYFRGFSIITQNDTTFANCDTTLTTGIDLIQQNNSFSVYPNPTSGKFTIILPANDAEIMVTNLLGQEIIKTRATKNSMDLWLDQNGIYILYIRTNQKIESCKLVVSH